MAHETFKMNLTRTEVLDYLEFLLVKAEREDKEWSRFSLTSAMRSMNDEPELYTLADLKVKYS